jgi:ADP-ribose pyrophosphatase
MSTESSYGRARSARARVRYHELRRDQPDWFANQAGGFEILTSDTDMDRAEESAWERLQSSRARGEVSVPVDREWVMVGVLAEDAWGVVLRDAILTPAGELSVYRREMTAPDRPAGVVALAARDDKVVLLKHYRHALRRFSWELPRGFAARYESPEQTLTRQLAEEIQASPERMRHLGRLEPDGGRLGDAVHLLSATITAPGTPERAEAIERYDLVDLPELRRRVRSNEVTDALTLAAIAKAYCDGDLLI